jgi:hypothetical protein
MKFHKNLHVVALFAAMFALSAQAIPVSPAQARRAVSAWAAANGSAFANSGTALSAEPEYDTDGKTVLYYKVKMSNGGLVITSPDTDLDLVVAILENCDGNFPNGHPLPSILKADMRKRLSVIASGASAAAHSVGLLSVTAQSASSQSASESSNLPSDVKESIRKSNALWEKYGSSSAMRMLSVPSEEEVAPYVRRIVDGFEMGGRFTHWNQGEGIGGKPCYNYYTPGKEVCGCVATAGAAIMQFFGCVEDIGKVSAPEGTNCYLYGNVYPCNTLSGAIDWSALDSIASRVVTNVTSELDEETGSSTKQTNIYTRVYLLDEKAPEVAGRVTYNLGVLVGMGWGTEFDEHNMPVPDHKHDESGASLAMLPQALKTYGFETARHVSFNSDNEDPSQYFKMVYAQNWAGAPVVLGIQGENGGHAVVACGYAKTADDEELCRVFMGWGGFGDAWYQLPTVDDFEVVNEAVTMIGYDASKNIAASDLLGKDDSEVKKLANDMFNKYGTVPVCGKATRANIELTFPGVTKSFEGEEGEEGVSFTLTTTTDENGFFAVRIPHNTEDLQILHEETGTAAPIAPFDSKVLKDEETDRASLENAMPAEMVFLVLNTTVKPTVATAREKALEDGKAVLMVSGAGSIRENLLIDYITYLDSNTDISNKFVLVRINSSDDSSPDGDGDPSIGVFDPADGSAELRWWESNGRLSYGNFLDYEADNQSGLKYLFNGKDTSALTNIVDAVIATGYDKYARLHSGITVTVRAVDMDTGADITGVVGALPQYGVHENCWTNGEMVVFAAPLACTNDAAGISYSCVGWTTNGSTAAWDVSREYSNEVVLASNDKLDFTWLLKVKAYRVKSAGLAAVGGVNFDGAITPAEAWRYPGERVTIVAAGLVYDEYNLPYGLKDWIVRSALANNAECDPSEIAAVENGTAYSFTVDKPVNVTAKYDSESSSPGAPADYSVSVSMPSELERYANAEDSALGLGPNSTYDRYASIAALSSQIFDATGGVWVCTGYVQNGVTNSPSGLIELSSGASTDIELLWELQEPEMPPVPDPGPISVSSLSRSADGEWSIAVEGAVKDCFYTLYAADDISKLSGPSDSWTADKVETKKAAADGEPIVFKMTPTANAQFWRVKASGTRE